MDLIELGNQMIRVAHIDASPIGFIYQNWTEIASELNITVKSHDEFVISAFLDINQDLLFILRHYNGDDFDYYMVAAQSIENQYEEDEDEDSSFDNVELKILNFKKFQKCEDAVAEMCKEYLAKFNRSNLKVVK